MVLATIFVLLIFCYSLVSRLLGRSVITGPIIFTTAGIVVPAFLPVSIEIEEHLKTLLLVAEMGRSCCSLPMPVESSLSSYGVFNDCLHVCFL